MYGGERLSYVTDYWGHSHVIRALFALSYETFEVTGPQMVLVMKLTTFAWNVYDGRRPVEVRVVQTCRRHYDTNRALLKDLDKWQKEKRVVQYPSLLAFLGYA